MSVAAGPDLVEIHIRGLPLALHRRASQHYDELFREFSMLLDPADGSDVPARVLDLVRQLEERFSGFTVENRQEMDEAADAGDTTIDLVYRLPPEAGPASADLRRLLRDADEFCRQGDLLTLAAPAELWGYVDWYLGEFSAQVGGAEPTPYGGGAVLGGDGVESGAPP